MRLAIALTLPAFAFAAPALAAESYTFDKGHTEILFSWDHLGNSTQHAEFRDLEGTVTLDEAEPANSAIDVAIPVSSIDTGVPAFDEHMLSSALFEGEAYPEITFKSTEVDVTGDGRAEVTGDLTIKGVTKPVTMDVELNYIGEHQLSGALPEMEGAYVAGFTATAVLNRSEFGLGYLVPMVGDEVTLTINTELLREDGSES